MKKQSPATPVRTAQQNKEYAQARQHNHGKAERQANIRLALDELGRGSK